MAIFKRNMDFMKGWKDKHGVCLDKLICDDNKHSMHQLGIEISKNKAAHIYTVYWFISGGEGWRSETPRGSL